MEDSQVKRIAFVLISVFVIAGVSPLFARGNNQNQTAPVRQAKIQYACWGNADEKATEEAIVAKFMELNPGIEVEYIHVDGNYSDKILLMISGGEAPDVMAVGTGLIPSILPALMPLDNARIDKSKYASDLFLERLIYEGRQYALPKRVSTKVIVYNKDLLTRAGVAFPGSRYSIDQFTLDAQTITSRLGIYASDPLWFGQWVFQFGGAVMNTDGTPAFNDATGKQAAQYIVDSTTRYQFAPPAIEMEGQDAMQWFVSQKVAFKCDFGAFYLPLMAQIKSFDWDIAPAPGNGGEMELVGIAVSSGTKSSESALRFVEFVSNSRDAQDIIASTTSLPVITESKAAFIAQYPERNLQAFFDAIQDQGISPTFKGSRQIGGILFGHLLQRTPLGATGTENVSIVLDDAARDVQAALAEAARQ
jgi:multiple sugar transport system substrate-binding protein